MKTALIIIDMQNGFINENTKELIPKISLIHTKKYIKKPMIPAIIPS